MNINKKSLGALMAVGIVALCSCGSKVKWPALPIEEATPYFADGVKGFNGPTPLLIALDAEGRIKTVALLENQETPRFAQRMVEGGLYDALNGLTVDEALGKDVDAVSGATYTSNGVKNSLIARLKAYQKQLK